MIDTSERIFEFGGNPKAKHKFVQAIINEEPFLGMGRMNHGEILEKLLTHFDISFSNGYTRFSSKQRNSFS